ncbi:unnamed protein product [Urochloa humidicola]
MHATAATTAPAAGARGSSSATDWSIVEPLHDGDPPRLTPVIPGFLLLCLLAFPSSPHQQTSGILHGSLLTTPVDLAIIDSPLHPMSAWTRWPGFPLRPTVQ